MRAQAIVTAVLLGLGGCGDDKGGSEGSTSSDSSGSSAASGSSASSGSSGSSGGASATDTGGGEGDPSKYSESCAPDDGSAVEFSIAISARECTASFPDGGPALRIVLYQGVDLPVGEHKLDGQMGFASFDDGGGMPLNAQVGTLTVSSISADGLVGSYDLTFTEGTHLTGSFDALYCPQDVLCG